MWRILGLALVFSGGCTTFEHPIVAEESATIDPRLLGQWVFENEEGRYEWVVRAEGGVIIASATGSTAGGEPEIEQIRFVTARVGRRDYGSAQDGKPDADSASKGWTLFHYEIRRNQLEILFIDDDILKSAVERGELPGTVETKWKPIAHVSATPEQIRAWLEKHPKAWSRDPEERWIFRRAPAEATPRRR